MISPRSTKKQTTSRQARQRSYSVWRFLGIVGLACLTVSLVTHWRLLFGAMVPENDTNLESFMAGVPAPEETGERAEETGGPVSLLGVREGKQPQQSKLPLTPEQEKLLEDRLQQHLEKQGEPFQPTDNPDYPNSNSTFAYGFVIGGCDPDMPSTYQNYLFNIAVAARILRERGSKADVISLFQVSGTAKRTQLNDSDLRILHALGVYVYYIPQQTAGQQSFYRTQLDKFRILGFQQYKRIMFLDGDVMPTANLDYLFELSLNGTFQENVVLQGKYEPANGGFFMVTPGYLQQMQDIITWRERTALELSYPYFDVKQGWGHALAEDDPWRAKKESGTNWTFLAAFADQGLLYHYTKYARQSVSISMRTGTVENWGAVQEKLPNGTMVTTVKLVKTLGSPYDGIDSNRIKELPSGFEPMPINNMVHFTGRSKPWMGGGPPVDCCHNSTFCCSDDSTRFKSNKHYWFWQLSQINQKLKLGLNFALHWQEKYIQRPPLGLYPLYRHVLNASSNVMTPLERVYPTTKDEYNIL
jgi:hypothetical protein